MNTFTKHHSFTVKVLSCAVLTVLLGACTMAPRYQAPDIAHQDQWIDSALSEQSKTMAHGDLLTWQSFFLDPQLRTLIDTALLHNHDLQKARLNSELLQAQYGIARANALPTVGGNLGYQRSQNARDFSPLHKQMTSNSYQAGVGMPQFEIDFFGRVQSMKNAALNRYLATQEAQDSAKLAIISAVAKTYYQTRILSQMMQISKALLDTQQKRLDLAKIQLKNGIIPADIVAAIRSQYDSAQATYHEQQQRYQQAMNGLSQLIGVPTATLTLPQGNDLSQQFAAMSIPANLTSAVLQNRPDIRQAEYELKAANANIGAARAAFFPSISLTGNAGFGSTDLDHLFDGENFMWSFAPKINLPIFSAGKLQANLKISQIQQKMMIENYRQSIEKAFTDVANALNVYKALQTQYRAQQDAVEAMNKRSHLEHLRQKHGMSSAMNVLDAEQARLGTQQGALATQLQLLNSQVDVYSNLGGNFKTQKEAHHEQTQ